MAGRGSVKLSIYSTFKDDGVKRAEKAVNSFIKEYGKLDKETGRKTVDDATRALAEQSVQLDLAAARWRGYSETLEAAGTALTKYVSAPAAAVAAATTKLASDFEDGFAKVKTIMDKAAVAPEALSAQILQLSTDTGRAATELTEAAYQALSASVATEDVTGFVADAVDLAKVGFTETATAVDTLTTIINAYGMSATDAEAISDKLVQTQNRGKTTVNELAASMGNVIPTAAAYGVNLDNLSTAYVALTKQGINTANATTMLNGMMTELADSGSTVAGILQEKTGKTFGQLMADGESLGDVLGILQEHVGGNSEEFANLWGNVRASKGALAIANAGVDEFNRELSDMQNASGNVSAALGDLDTASARANRAINAVKNTGIELGQQFLGALSPALEAAAAGAQGLYSWFSSLDEGTKQAVAGAIAAAAAAGPVVLAASKVAGGIAAVLSAAGSLTAALAVLRTTGSLTGVTIAGLNPATLAAVAAIVTLTACAAACAKGIYDHKVRLDEARGATTGLVEASTSLSRGLGDESAAFGAMGAAAGRARADIESVTRAQAELAQSIADRNDGAAAEIAQLERARDVIGEYMNQTGLTAQQQGELIAAVDLVNEKCGTQITVTDALNGKLADEEGAILDNCSAIDEYIRAKEKQIRADALTENLSALYKQQADDIRAVGAATADLKAAQADLAEAEAAGVTGERWQEYADAVAQAEQALGEAKADLDAVNSAIEATNEQLGNTQAAAAGAELTLGQLASTRGEISEIVPADQLQAFCSQLDSTGISVESFSKLSQDKMMELATSYDGSTESIIAAARRIGLEVPEGMDAASKAGEKGRETGRAYASGLSEGEGPTHGAASALASAASAMSAGDSWSWGSHLGQNFASGIGSAQRAVAAAASGLASAVSSLLGHSIAKTGPLHNRGRGEAEWGLHAAENFARGMRSGAGLVERASAAAAQAAAAGFQATPAMAFAGAGAGELRLAQADIRQLCAEISRAASPRGAGGSWNVNVYAGDGMDPEAVADAVVREIDNILSTGA